jgi:TolB protein
MKYLSRREVLRRGLIGVIDAYSGVDLSKYRVVFSSNRDSSSKSRIYNLYTINAGKTNEKNIERLTKGDFYDRRSCFSPNGKYIAFESNREGLFQIYIMKSNGGDVDKLTEEGINIFPYFSSNDNLFFYSKENDKSPWRISFMNVNDKKIKTIRNPDWDVVSDESKLIYDPNYIIRLKIKATIKELLAEKGEGIIEAIDQDGLNSGTVRTPFVLGYSPEKKIVFHSDKTGDDDVYVVGLNGKNEGLLIKNSAIDKNPYLSSDGKVLVFDSIRGRTWSIFVKPIGGLGGIEKRLTKDKAFDRFPCVGLVQ